MMPVRITQPSGMTRAEAEAFQWALSGLDDALTDARFLADNPGIEDDDEGQQDDVLYRLEDQAKDMAHQSPEFVSFAAAARRAAKKFRAAIAKETE